MKRVILIEVLGMLVSKRRRGYERKDHYYRQAKKDRYRSRAAYKLLQMDEKFGIFHAGDRVVDLGASPGGWSQVAAELVGPTGRVIGVDIRPIRPIERVEFVRGDIRDGETLPLTLERLNGPADVVLSDMSPNISGSYPTDHARSVELCEHALRFSRRALREGGTLVMKVFEGDMYAGLLAMVRRHFRDVKGHNPRASRAASSEIYVIARDFVSQSPPSII